MAFSASCAFARSVFAAAMFRVGRQVAEPAGRVGNLGLRFLGLVRSNLGFFVSLG